MNAGKFRYSSVKEFKGIEAGQIWELQRGANKKPQPYKVISISGMPASRFGRAVYLRHVVSGRLANVNVNMLLTGKAKRLQ